VETGEGTLNYTLTFPPDAHVTSLKLTRSDRPDFDLATDDITSGTLNTATVGAGYWFLKAVLTNDEGVTAGLVDVVYIYSNFETEATYEFAANEFKPILIGSVSITWPDSETRSPLPGDTLTADISVISGESGEPAYQWKKNGTAIPDETDLTYDIPSDTETGDTFTVTVTYNNGDLSDTTPAVPGIGSVSITWPDMGTHDPLLGDTLTADTSGISNAVGTLVYEWKKNGTAIPDETDLTYDIPSDTERGDTFTVTVTDGSRSTSSEPTPGVIDTGTTGTITLELDETEATINVINGGNTTISRTTANNSFTVEVSGDGFTGDVEWYVDGILETGETASSITIDADDYGVNTHSLNVRVYKDTENGNVPYSADIKFTVTD
jgi:hypothetical protein